MHFGKQLGVASVCGFMTAILLFGVFLQAASQISFTSPYRGITVRGIVGSSVQFNWTFSGDVSIVRWGLTTGAGAVTLDKQLLFMTKLKSVPVKSVPSYTGRVSGSRIAGKAIITLSKVETSDTRFYGCEIRPTALDDTAKFDNVKLVVEAPPNITHISANQTVNEGDNVTLNCTADGIPSPSISWTKLSDNSVVTMPLTGIRRQDEGGYRCTADNGVGNPVSGNVFITVQSSPNITHISANQTVNEGDNVNLNCTADGNPSPSISWTKLSDNSVVTMPLTGIRRQDEGGYRCTANNGIGESVSSDVFITVQYKPKGVTISTNATQNIAKQGQNVALTCDVSEAKPPVSEYRFYFNGSILTPVTNVNKFIIQDVKRSQQFGKYKCVAHNDVGDGHSDQVFLNINVPAEIQLVTGNLTVNETNPIDLRCYTTGYPSPAVTWRKVGGQTFQGSVLHIASSTKMNSGKYVCVADNGVGRAEMKTFITVQYQAAITSAKASETQSWIGQKIRLECVADGVPTPDITWRKPDGNEMKKDGVTHNIVDVQMENDHDFGNYTCEAENGVGVTAISTVQVNQIKAPGSPRITVEIEATSLTITWTAPDYDGGSPITGYHAVILHGGKVIENKTLGAAVREYPFDDLKRSTNYTVKVSARNKFFDGDASELRVKIKYKVTTKPSENQRGSGIVHVVYIPAIIFLVMAIVFLIVLAWRMRRRPCPRCGAPLAKNQVSPQEEQETQPLNGEQANEPPTYATPTVGDCMALYPSGRSWEISREQVTVIKVIGKGAFSQVAQATVRDMRGRQENITIAVKMLKENAPDSDRKDLLSELELMKKLEPHPHVIKLIGCVTQNDPLLVLIEYVPFGDLLGYLRKSRGLNDTYYEAQDVKQQSSLTAEQLMKFAWQVADGMCYLSSKKIIHRDLAARNILVGEEEMCKVTDFKMARNANQDDIYTRKIRGRLPVKWTAYEALMYGTYTTQSDVWSYGILLYEILTVGGSPYPNINARDIAKKIKKGYRLPQPRHVDSKLFEILLKCWKEKPNDRPTFDELRNTMEDMWKQHETYVNLSKYDDWLYVNRSDLTAE